jgi:beta-lactam-binding protein with PASTA domain
MVGMTVSNARTAWSNAGFNNGTFSPSSGSSSNVVTAQDETAGACMVASTTVTVQHQAPCSVVPDMVGMTLTQARAAWSAAGFTGSFSPASGSNTNVVTSQNRTVGSCVTASTTVTVQHQPPCVTVPNLIGMTVAEARAAWSAAGFTGSFSPASGSSTRIVVSQNRTAGSCLAASTTVTVTHEACFTVPNLLGLTLTQARAAWSGAGFTGSFSPASGSNSNTVTGQNQAAGDCLIASTTITVTHQVPCFAVPNLVGMTVSQARTAWTGAGFTGSFSPSTGSSSNVVYAQSVPAGGCLTASTSISVSHAAACSGSQRMVPALVGMLVGDARAAWSAAGFTGTFTPSSGQSTRTVVTQSRAAGSCTSTNSTITVTYQ